jgi:hypothetical protein
VDRVENSAVYNTYKAEPMAAEAVRIVGVIDN